MTYVQDKNKEDVSHLLKFRHI